MTDPLGRPDLTFVPEYRPAADEYVVLGLDLAVSEAAGADYTFDVIDRLLREVLSWRHGQISVEEPTDGPRAGSAPAACHTYSFLFRELRTDCCRWSATLTDG